MKATAAALLVVAGLSWSAQANSKMAQPEPLALECEGTKISEETPPPVFDDAAGTYLPRPAPRTGKQEPVSTQIIVAFASERVYGFDKEFASDNSIYGKEFGLGSDDGATTRFGFSRSSNNGALILEGFFASINRFTGLLKAEHLQYNEKGWLTRVTRYSLNCMKTERKF
jgi:hypothetical protein